jgi:hypothetical protein
VRGARYGTCCVGLRRARPILGVLSFLEDARSARPRLSEVEVLWGRGGRGREEEGCAAMASVVVGAADRIGCVIAAEECCGVVWVLFSLDYPRVDRKWGAHLFT